MLSTLVIGASSNPERYAYKAIVSLRSHGHTVIAISKQEGEVMGVRFQKPFPKLAAIDTVTLYINATHQKDYYAFLLNLKPRRVIFNPGTENEELEALLKLNDIEPIMACTLVMLSIGVY